MDKVCFIADQTSHLYVGAFDSSIHSHLSMLQEGNNELLTVRYIVHFENAEWAARFLECFDNLYKFCRQRGKWYWFSNGVWGMDDAAIRGMAEVRCRENLKYITDGCLDVLFDFGGDDCNGYLWLKS